MVVVVVVLSYDQSPGLFVGVKNQFSILVGLSLESLCDAILESENHLGKYHTQYTEFSRYVRPGPTAWTHLSSSSRLCLPNIKNREEAIEK